MAKPQPLDWDVDLILCRHGIDLTHADEGLQPCGCVVQLLCANCEMSVVAEGSDQCAECNANDLLEPRR